MRHTRPSSRYASSVDLRALYILAVQGQRGRGGRKGKGGAWSGGTVSHRRAARKQPTYFSHSMLLAALAGPARHGNRWLQLHRHQQQRQRPGRQRAQQRRRVQCMADRSRYGAAPDIIGRSASQSPSASSSFTAGRHSKEQFELSGQHFEGKAAAGSPSASSSFTAHKQAKGHSVGQTSVSSLTRSRQGHGGHSVHGGLYSSCIETEEEEEEEEQQQQQ